MIKFSVNDKIYEIEKDVILKYKYDTYLKNLVEHYEKKDIGVDIKNDAIVIDEDNDVFEMILNIYKRGIMSNIIDIMTNNKLKEKMDFYNLFDSKILSQNIAATNKLLNDNYL